LRLLKSRAAAVALLLNLLIAFAIGDGPIFHARLLWPSVRAVEATWNLRSGTLKAESDNQFSIAASGPGTAM